MSLKPLQIPVKIKMKQLGCTRFASWGTTGPLCLAIQPTAILEVRLARGPWPSQSLSVVILKKKQQPVPIFLFKNPNPTLTTYVFFELTMLSAQQNQTIQVGASGSRSESPVTGASEPEVSIFHKGGAKEPEFPNHAETLKHLSNTFCFVWTSWVTQAPGPSRFRSPRTTP